MKILLIHQAFAALNEAGGTRHHELACFLAEQGHQVEIIASPVSYLTGSEGQVSQLDRGAETMRGSITIHRCYTYQKLHKSFFHRLISFFSFMASSFIAGMQVRQVDVVWGTSPPIFQAVSAWLIARLKGKPFLLEIRDLWPLFAVEIGVLKNKSLIRMSQWLERFLYRQADCAVVNSPGFIDHLRQRGARRIELVTNGADPALFAAEEGEGEAFRRQHCLDDKFIVMYAGAHGISNDLEVVLAAADLLRAHESIHFLLVGDGKEKQNMIARASDLGLKNITFLPPVSKNQMKTVFSAADISLAILKPLEGYKTTYPNKVFDSMAAGRAVLLAIDGVVRQVVEEARAGVFVPPGDGQAMADAILQLAGDPLAVKQMGTNGAVAVAEKFNRKDQADKLEEVILSLLSK